MAGIFSAALGAIAAFLLDGGIGIKQTDLPSSYLWGVYHWPWHCLGDSGTGYLPAAELVCHAD